MTNRTNPEQTPYMAEPTDEEVEAVARPIYDILEGPVNNQDATRQLRQWEFSKTLARGVIRALDEMGRR